MAGYDLCTGWGTPNGTNMINTLTPLVLTPVLAGVGFTLVNEGCLPTNGAIDSGETVTVSFALKNISSIDSTNLVATLLATNGVGLPSGPQTYGVVTAGGSAVSQPFTFVAVGSCGSTINPTFQLQDNGANLGTVTFSIPLGKLAASFTENFDEGFRSSTAGGLDESFAGGSQSLWVTSSFSADSLPNAAFTACAATVGSNALVTANIALPAGAPGTLSFRNSYNLEARTVANDKTTGYDGGVLEIKIGAGSFTDILAAGGTFVSGGYNRTISSSLGNPLSGRRAWSRIPTVSPIRS